MIRSQSHGCISRCHEAAHYLSQVLIMTGQKDDARLLLAGIAEVPMGFGLPHGKRSQAGRIRVRDWSIRREDTITAFIDGVIFIARDQGAGFLKVYHDGGVRLLRCCGGRVGARIGTCGGTAVDCC